MARSFLLLCLFLCVVFAASVEVNLVQTSKGTLDRLSPKGSLTFQVPLSKPSNRVVVDSSETFQEIEGFGGAFTEASALNFDLLNPTLQEEVLELYWGEHGIGYSMGRVHMNSCDFSLFSYNFDNVSGDTSLLHFDNEVAHDQQTMIPFILRANATAAKCNHPIKLFITPWSPPAWMKYPVNGIQSMDGSAQPNGLIEEYMSTWALYFSKFISAYQAQGVAIWGLTVQNEPEYAAVYEALCYNATYESYFIEKYLGPQIRSDFPDMKIMGYDHNRNDVYTYAETLYSNNVTKGFLDGIAFHWYESNELYNVNKTYWLDTDKFVLATEGCNCPGVDLGNWDRAENYGRDIIADLNFYSVGWVDWNLVLNSFGGPNHAQNYCDAMVIADIEQQELNVQPSYYYMGQISKFVPRGSVRIKSHSHLSFDTPPGSIPYVENGFNSIVASCNGAPNQLWNVTNSRIELLNGNGMCLDVEDWSEENGANVQLYECGDNQANQQWTANLTTGEIVSVEDGKCLDVLDFSKESGANVQTWDCHGQSNQEWKFLDDGTIRPGVNDDLCLTSGWSAFQHVAFTTPEGHTVLVVMNSSESDVSFGIEDKEENEGSYVNTSIPARSIQTYTWKYE